MLTLKGLKKAEQFVSQQQEAGNDVRWDGWDIVFFRSSDKAIFSREGAFRNDAWGFDNRVSVDESGIWNIDYRNVKRTPRPRI